MLSIQIYGSHERIPAFPPQTAGSAPADCQDPEQEEADMDEWINGWTALV